MGFFGGGGKNPSQMAYAYGAPDSNSPSGGYFTGSPEDYFNSSGLGNGSPGGGGGGNETGAYAQAIGGGTKALVGLMMGNKELKYQKRISGIQHQQVREQFKDSMKGSSMGEIDTLRQHDRGVPDAMGQLSGAGMGNSSAANQMKEDMGYQRDTRLNAIQRQRALMVGGMAAQESIWDLQKKMARAQQQSAAIAAGIDTAISVAQIASDERVKRNFTPVQVLDVLEKLDNLPVMTWTYEWERDDVKHMGPMAQDFHRIFGLGKPQAGRTMMIDQVDLFGVMLASIKALSARVKELEQKQG